MSNLIWYNRAVPITSEKKSETLPMKVQASVLREVEKIASKEDRPIGYVARELMLRGLALYEKDGHLRDVVQSGKKQSVPLLKEKAK